MTLNALSVLRLSPVMPVIVIRDAARAVDLAHALVAGGIRALEVTLRTAAALEAIRAIRDAVPQAVVGAGTVCTPDQLKQAIDAGAAFAISPGLPSRLAVAGRDCGIPLIPGIATPTEAMEAQDQGYDVLKLFPAEAVGGKALLKAIGGPLPHLTFCPTGGIDVTSAPGYLALPNVAAVGGSWLTPDAAVAAGDWEKIIALATEASALGG
ncbi:bifunctional 4-hydroxy-2-oxoglutarate aldolase/2-dehydro-3-deoxy-phosphogluconate aldolase [Novispirillum itersonii]|uniref:2-dehydro-3-deoxy-phosphogluconate aldolase n=1 Tax=Novispirillum itersonii TaxID=189 RepID=A0A7W9ZL49_NOVIT|nr:bifunctional 4-hydroxy-2-oxoglutarate aldolase/2-dehydro-3-deoxy-phosphogluconate aldolase [Novispirillum itersonii]MBB6212229.1 2-dehydro-3-deoxyphosphogluconate aldolase/(4S)-4-hydroxy-2-oxoglutarate aldolase [Novispirillum itersonii]